jgi:hypothetical protein
MTRNPKIEGRIRLRLPSDPIEAGKIRQSKYILYYLGAEYTPRAFMEKYCPEFQLNKMLYYVAREYSPAEIIVRYNAKHTPIHEPKVDYDISDLDKKTRVLPTKKVRLAKARREKKNTKPIERKLIL